MRRAWLVLFIVPWVSVSAQGPDVRIVELLPDPGEGREFIELWSDTAIDLTGWAIEDAAGNRFDLSGHGIAAGGRIVVWGGGEATAEGPAWSKAAVWNNGGDTAYLLSGETIVDSFTYGPGGEPVPPTGQSLALVGDAWQAGDPTPGRAPGGQGGTATVTVEDVPPEAVFLDLPMQASPGEVVEVRWSVTDDNGDPVAWNLTSDGAVVAQGTEPGEHTQGLTAPGQGPWRLRLEAVAGGQTVFEEATIGIQQEGLRVTLPAEGLRFPPLVPGAEGIVASAPFTIHNDGAAAVEPRIDIADFVGPETFPSTGRVHLEVAGVRTTYTDPLTALPSIPAGGSADVLLVLDAPSPLAAGTYGTSFTVVA